MKTGTLKSKATGREIPGVNLIRTARMFYTVRLDPLGPDSTNNMPKDLWEFVPDRSAFSSLRYGTTVFVEGYYPIVKMGADYWVRLRHYDDAKDVASRLDDSDVVEFLGRHETAKLIHDGETIKKEDYL